ncbi:MAG TPA: symmetrical bis(5'-nucleosyl)-tetraphosphatase [Rhodocyclaceae bacterium]|nr:symmetrical bis(5'-nucleosyl)-tetraphosphatase [Rhodocyclaceae bacterium]
MATYAVGDLQGCLDPLKALLADAAFSPEQDRLWLVGDLVNRGPQSVEVLRFLCALGPAVTAVLGNHDLYLLAVAAGLPAKDKLGDTIDSVLEAPDRDELVDWLRGLPLMHVEGDWAMVHAGLLPQWSVAQALALAEEVTANLRSDDWCGFLLELFGNKPAQWGESLRGWDRYRIVINALTRLRFITVDGALELKPKGTPENAPEGLIPWYAATDAAWRTHTILCGHWSALGLRDLGHVVALDSGCIWGGKLSALRLEDRRIFQVDCPACSQINVGD